MSDEPIRRGQQAQRILDDEIFKDAIEALTKRALDEFKSASPENDVALKVARLRYTVTEDFVNEIHKFVRDGEFALSKQK